MPKEIMQSVVYELKPNTVLDRREREDYLKMWGELKAQGYFPKVVGLPEDRSVYPQSVSVSRDPKYILVISIDLKHFQKKLEGAMKKHGIEGILRKTTNNRYCCEVDLLEYYDDPHMQ